MEILSSARQAIAALIVGIVVGFAPAVLAQDQTAEPPPPDGVPVMHRGAEVYRVYAPYGMLSAQERARRVEARLDRAVDNPAFDPAQLTVADGEDAAEIFYDGELIGVVTSADAAAAGRPRLDLARFVVARVTQVVIDSRAARTWQAITRGVALALLQTVILAAALWGLWRLRRRLLTTPVPGATNNPLGLAPVVSVWSWLVRSATMVVGTLAVLVWLSLALAELPWTQPYASRVFSYAAAPFQEFGRAFIAYLPSLFFVLATVAIAWWAIRMAGVFFSQIETGAITIENFPTDWGAPTFRLVRLLLLAIALVAVYPYIPGSQSPAFQGVSLFLGFLISLSSSSALSNAIAGTILTYTRAFRVGDLVRMGDATGTVLERSLLVTRIRTPKAVVVTVPNALVLGGQVLNYSEAARGPGIILHTKVTIGYDAPWRDVTAALITAARATPEVVADPAPFVLQTALNDFYVEYELNAYTKHTALLSVYSRLHENIQDSFAAAGIEIMSPHYEARRDGSASTIPPSPPRTSA